MADPVTDATDDLIAALTASGAAEPVIDGRRRRAERGRAAVVAATLRLVDGGHPAPTFADIAEESGVSERTIFRYYPDRDALLGAVATEVYPRIAHCLTVEPPPGEVRSRVRALVDLRMDLADRTAGLARSIDRLAPSSPLGGALLGLRNGRLLEQVRAWFAPELGDDLGPAATIDVMLGQASISRLVEVIGRDRARSELVRAVARIVDTA